MSKLRAIDVMSREKICPSRRGCLLRKECDPRGKLTPSVNGLPSHFLKSNARMGKLVKSLGLGPRVARFESGCAHQPSSVQGPDGGTGRRGGFKSRWPKGRAGSSPAPGTKSRLLLIQPLLDLKQKLLVLGDVGHQLALLFVRELVAILDHRGDHSADQQR